MGFAVIMLSVGAEKRTSELCSASTNTRFPDTEYCVNQILNLKGNTVRLRRKSRLCVQSCCRDLVIGDIKQSKVDGMYLQEITLLISAREHSYSKVASRSMSRLVYCYKEYPTHQTVCSELPIVGTNSPK